MVAQYLWIAGSLIIGLLAGAHLYLTFFTDKFSSRNERLIQEMKTSSPILTKDLTMWKAWIGFNASHSMGGIFIGLINLYLAIRYFRILQSDHFYLVLNILTIGFYIWLAKKYWFKTPFRGLSLTLAFYVFAYVYTIIFN